MTTQTKSTAKNTRQTADRQLQQGINKRLPNLALVILGKPYTAKAIDDTLQGRIDAGDKTIQAHGAWIAAAQAEKQLVTDTAPVVSAVKQAIRIQVGNDAAALADFGMKPRTKRAPTAKEKAAAVDKVQATRKARGTKGKVQRSKIHGTPTEEPTAEPPVAEPPAQASRAATAKPAPAGSAQ